jgi:seryl-tRNA synthetase
MLAIQFIRSHPDQVQAVCEKRDVSFDVQQLLAVDRYRTKLLKEVEVLRTEANRVSSLVKQADPAARIELVAEGARIKRDVKIVEDLLGPLEREWLALQRQVPNLVADDVPLGNTEADNEQIAIHGVEPCHAFAAKDHIALASGLGLDFEAGARIAGTGFPLMRGKLARLEQAMLRFCLDEAIALGFEQISTPLLARPHILEGLGFNPRREDAGTEIFSTAQDNLCLIGTAEIPLVGQFADQVVELSGGPIKLVAMTPCFRREGAAGRRDAGLYRNKMFWKTELVILAPPELSTALLEEIRAFEERFFQKLGLYFRVIKIAAGDLGAPAFKKYDLEAWMLGRGADEASADWGEVTSCSNCTDYQARRLNIRYRKPDGKLDYVHTLNGTGVTTRALIPLLEQNQRADGSIQIPTALRSYTGFETIEAPAIVSK